VHRSFADTWNLEENTWNLEKANTPRIGDSEDLRQLCSNSDTTAEHEKEASTFVQYK
jgi:hypothetical protein